MMGSADQSLGVGLGRSGSLIGPGETRPKVEPEYTAQIRDRPITERTVLLTIMDCRDDTGPAGIMGPPAAA
eukprot:176781-Hanusia_phi.AAC.1